MLTIAQEKAKTMGLHQVGFQEMDAEYPLFSPGSFNAVLCRFGLMLLPNLTTALTKSRQLLVPGGRFAAAVWGTADQVAYTVLSRTIRRVRQLSPPPPGRPNAFSLGNEDILSQHFRDAGFAEVHTERSIATFEYTSPEHYFQERLATTPAARTSFIAATEDEQTAIRNAATEEPRDYTEADGTIRLPNAVICCVAW